jgi:hypothetical protein
MSQIEHEEAQGNDLHPCADGGNRQPGPKDSEIAML